MTFEANICRDPEALPQKPVSKALVWWEEPGVLSPQSWVGTPALQCQPSCPWAGEN